MQSAHSISCEECLKRLNSSRSGLSKEQVKINQGFSKNLQIKEDKKQNIFLKFLMQFSDLMVAVLLIASLVSIVVGIVQNTMSEIFDGIIILVIVFINAIFGVVQEWKSEKAMRSLKNLTAPKCLAIREGVSLIVDSKDLVLGDVVVLEAGTIFSCDCRLIESVNLLVDESSLTGESVAVEKNCFAKLQENTPLAERENMVFAGTVVVGGRGLAVVCGIGTESELGKIAKIVSTTKKELSPLQKNIKEVGKILTFIILLIAGITFLLEVLAKGQPLEAFLTAIAISVAAIPESLPAVITIIMSIGISRLSKQKAIIKRMHAVETLGCCDVICSDKTGTITQNEMKVEKIFFNGSFCRDKNPDEKFFNTLLLCNDVRKSSKKYIGDPTEVALALYGKKAGFEKTEFENKYPRLKEICFDSGRKMMSVLNRVNNELIVSCKGSVDSVLSKCEYIFINNEMKKLTESLKQQVLKANEKMTKQALRVLAFAFKKSNSVAFTESELVFQGLVGMIDPPKKETFEAVRKCKKAKIRPIMITGDHKDTAFAIAKQVGIASFEREVLTGEEMDLLTDENLLKKMNDVKVYARVSPQNKVRVVTLLKEKGHVVAMTGDGVNDAPSIKAASIGVGMGKSGVDVVKDVSDLIISDDNFSTIIVAVEEGRKIYKNIQKTVKFLFSANMAEIFALFFTTIIFPGLTFLLPVQILFVNLITDSLPAIALGVERAETSIMEENPRHKKQGIFSNGVWKEIVVMGICQTLLVILAFLIGLKLVGKECANTMAFYTLNLLQLFYLLSVRTDKSIFKSNPFKNKLLCASFAFGFGVLLIIALSPLYRFLGLCNLSFSMWVVVLFLSSLVIVCGEVWKGFKNFKKQ